MDGVVESAKKPTLVVAIIILAVVLAVVAGYFVWRNFSKTPEERAAEALNQAAQTGALPTIDPGSNLTEKLPDTNPIEQTNPFGGTYKNPFQ